MSPGMLAENYSEILGLQTALARYESNMGLIPRLLRRIIRDNCWREWMTPEGQVVRWNTADFRRFLESPRPHGCQTPIGVVERALRGTDAWEPFQELVRGEQGGANNPYGCKGNPESRINRDPVTVDSPPDLIPFVPTDAPSDPAPRQRDYSREAPTGNSTSYALRRLGRERPDLYERVRAGELKPKTAMREAGFITPEFSCPVDPQRAARAILNRFQGEALLELIRVLANHAGLEVIDAEGECLSDGQAQA